MGPAIGAGVLLGAVKHNQDMAKYNREKELAAQTEQYSPWTHLHGKLPQSPGSGMEAALQGGMSGGMMGANLAAMGGGAPNPMAGATQVGGADSSMTPMGQEMYGGQGMNKMAGGFSESPWSQLMKPNLYQS